MQDAEPADVACEFRNIAARPRHDAFLGLHDGTPTFLVEPYDPADELGDASRTGPR